ncbi:hypothetical protein TSOC_005360, partial [Tetrabaena socialis]
QYRIIGSRWLSLAAPAAPLDISCLDPPELDPPKPSPRTAPLQRVMAASEAEPVKPVVVAGILLEVTPVEHVLKSLGLASQEELEAILAPSKEWPHHAYQDGWKMAHDAIRYDMDALRLAISKTKEMVDGGAALQAWQVKALQRATMEFWRFTRRHHDNEEEFIFPHMATRIQ